jgi:hypothetical protein
MLKINFKKMVFVYLKFKKKKIGWLFENNHLEVK